MATVKSWSLPLFSQLNPYASTAYGMNATPENHNFDCVSRMIAPVPSGFTQMVTDGARIASIGWLTSPTLEKSHAAVMSWPTLQERC